MKRGSGCCAVDIYCTAALTSLSDSISCITYLFSEWHRQHKLHNIYFRNGIFTLISEKKYFDKLVQHKNCAKCGKGYKIGTNEAYNIKIKIRLVGISKIFCFVLTPIWLPQRKTFH